MGYFGVVFYCNAFNYSSSYDELIMGQYISEWRGLVIFRSISFFEISQCLGLYFSLRNSITLNAVSGENTVQILKRMLNMNAEDAGIRTDILCSNSMLLLTLRRTRTARKFSAWQMPPGSCVLIGQQQQMSEGAREEGMHFTCTVALQVITAVTANYQLTVGLDLEGLLQPNWFYDFVNFSETDIFHFSSEVNSGIQGRGKVALEK